MAQKTVLLAEDDLEIRDILQDLLEAEGYDVIPASHGRQALEFLRSARGSKLPDLVVLDIMMPLDVEEVGGRLPLRLLAAERPVVLPHRDEPPRVRVGEGAEEHRVDDAEDRRVRADAEGDGAEHDGREAGGGAQAAQGVPDVGEHAVA